MNTARDIAFLRAAGIDENELIDELIHEAVRFLKEHPNARSIAPVPENDARGEANRVREEAPARPAASAPLSEAEVRLLRDTGASGLDGDAPTALADVVPVGIAVDYRRLVADALSKSEVVERLGVGDSRVRQRYTERSIYYVETPTGRVFPQFQFVFDGERAKTLPGLRRVLEAIDRSVHPVVVSRFFLSPATDLEFDGPEDVQTLSPRDWMMAGLPVEDVVRLAREL